MLYIFLSDKKVHHSEHLYKKKRILNIIKAISNYKGMLKDYCNEEKGDLSFFIGESNIYFV